MPGKGWIFGFCNKHKWNSFLFLGASVYCSPFFGTTAALTGWLTDGRTEGRTNWLTDLTNWLTDMTDMTHWLTSVWLIDWDWRTAWLNHGRTDEQTDGPTDWLSSNCPTTLWNDSLTDLLWNTFWRPDRLMMICFWFNFLGPWIRNHSSLLITQACSGNEECTQLPSTPTFT